MENLSWLSWFSIFTNIITIIGLVLAFIQIRDGARQSKKVNDLLGGLDNVYNSLTTRRIGDFPNYLPWVRRVLESAQIRIDIIVAVPAHGMLSAYEDWLRIEHAIKIKITPEMNWLTQLPSPVESSTSP